MIYNNNSNSNTTNNNNSDSIPFAVTPLRSVSIVSIFEFSI